MFMDWWGYLVAGIAWLGPASHLPSMRRIIAHKTADGMTPVLCGIATLSYGAWGGLVLGMETRMVLVLCASATLSLVTFLYVLRYNQGSFWYFMAWLAAAIACGVTAWRWNFIGVFIVVPIDLAWYVRAVRDLRKSIAGKAVSVWGWGMSVSANTAWTVAAIIEHRWAVAIHSGVLAGAAGAVMVWTWVVHKRHGTTIQPE